MKRIFVLLALMLCVLPLLSWTSPVYAQVETLEERIASYKQSSPQSLSAGQATQLSLRCKTAQVVFKNYLDKANRTKVIRAQVYAKQVVVLKTLLSTIDQKKVEAVGLKNTIQQYEGVIELFKNAQNEYIQLLSDGASMDCARDAKGFKSIIEIVRKKQQNTLAASAAIKNFANDRIRSALRVIRSGGN